MERHQRTPLSQRGLLMIGVVFEPLLSGGTTHGKQRDIYQST